MEWAKQNEASYSTKDFAYSFRKLAVCRIIDAKIEIWRQTVKKVTTAAYESKQKKTTIEMSLEKEGNLIACISYAAYPCF